MKMKLLNGKEIGVKLLQSSNGEVSLVAENFYVATLTLEGRLDLSRCISLSSGLELEKNGQIKLAVYQ